MTAQMYGLILLTDNACCKISLDNSSLPSEFSGKAFPIMTE